MRFFLVILILCIPIGYATYLLPNLPAQIPTHFGLNGEPDAWGNKNSIFVAPGILCGVGLFLYFLFQNLGKVDPKFSQNPENAYIFRDLSYGITGFLSVLSIIIIQSAASPEFNLDKYLFSFIGLSFAAFGTYMPKLQPNYFAGIRLPWTLENHANWKATHQLAGKYWLFGGIAQAIFCSWAPPKWSVLFFMSTLCIMVVVPIVFSYNFYRKNKN